MEGYLTLGSERAMPYANDVLLNFVLEIDLILLINVTLINLIFFKKKAGAKFLWCRDITQMPPPHTSGHLLSLRTHSRVVQET